VWRGREEREILEGARKVSINLSIILIDYLFYPEA
jgi:hypothetical protein